MTENKSTLINIELIPKELVIDLVGPTIKSFGDGLGAIANFVMLPLRKLDILNEKSYQDFVKKVNEKTELIPEENRDTSKFELVLKVLEDTRYQLNSEEMREYCSALIAGLIDNRKNTASTPRFSTILSNLTEKDAIYLKSLYSYNKGIAPIITFGIFNKNNIVGLHLLENIVLVENNSFCDPESFETLKSYGLIESFPNRESKQEAHQKLYEEFEKSDDLNIYKNDALKVFDEQLSLSKDGVGYSLDRGYIIITAIGTQFCSFIFANENE